MNARGHRSSEAVDQQLAELRAERSRWQAEERKRDAEDRQLLVNIIADMARRAIDERNQAIRELAQERERAAEERRQLLAAIESLTERLAGQQDGDGGTSRT